MHLQFHKIIAKYTVLFLENSTVNVEVAIFIPYIVIFYDGIYISIYLCILLTSIYTIFYIVGVLRWAYLGHRES